MRKFAQLLFGLGVSVVIAAGEVHAAGIGIGDTLIGVFEPNSVSKQGFVLNSPSLGQVTFNDNSATAVSSIVNSTATTVIGTPPLQTTGSKLQWGTDGFPIPPDENFSELIFFGSQIPASFNDPFLVGRLTFRNGTSLLSSLIFGATLSFYDNVVDADHFLGSDQVYITTTVNLGASVAQDADYVNICGNQSNICDKSLEAFEATQGGTGVTFDLYGTIVGDPQLFLTNVTLSPDQDPLTSGLVGTQLAVVPEPGSAGILAAALGLLGVFLRRTRAQTG